jgi:NitT/TauT family transport system ATP-binding protein
MTPLPIEAVRDLSSQGRWNAAVDLLRKQDVGPAADFIMTLPFEEQRALFRAMPIDFGASLIGHFPYFHAYVLLRSRRAEEIHLIVEAMELAELDQFLDALPEEAWQSLMNELADTHVATASGDIVTEEPPEEGVAVPQPTALAHIIEARQIGKSYQQPDGRQIQVIAPVNLSIEADTILALLGPSGSGKSTMLRMLSGLVMPSSGEVFWHEAPMARCRPNVAIVFQSFALFPWLTVLENVEAPLLALGMIREERRRRSLQALDSVGLKNFEMAYPKELSGGMKQRVGFARALAVEPEVLFMDEPFSALDVLTAENLRGEMMELWLAKKVPTRAIFLVTHNIEEAVLLADRIVVLGSNPAKIRADFRIPLRHPRDRKSPTFLLYVDYIYKVMTQPQLDLAPPSATTGVQKARPQLLPHARPGGVAGLLELLNDRKGKEDMYHIADELLLEVDDLLPIIDAAVLLGFVTVREGDVVMTPPGKEFAEADIRARKILFRAAVLAHVALLQQMKTTLESKSDHAMPLEFFRDILDEYLSEAEMRQQIDTALNWGRYADIFEYNPESDRLQLYLPARTGGST